MWRTHRSICMLPIWVLIVLNLLINGKFSIQFSATSFQSKLDRNTVNIHIDFNMFHFRKKVQRKKRSLLYLINKKI